MASTVDERVFLVAMSRLASRTPLFRTAFASVPSGMIQSTMELWECGLHCALRNELQEKLQATGIDHGRSIMER
jgi:hypothetical protein